VIFSLDVRRARNGDCLLLHYGTRSRPGLVVIDGGPAGVYLSSLKPRLDAIAAARRKRPGDALAIDLMMVSHIDDDHIRGIQDMLADLVLTAEARRPLPLKIRSFWHNTFDDIIGNSPKELLAAVTHSYGAASLAGEPEVEGLDESAAKVLASVSQGLRVRDDARKLKLRVNPQFRGRLVMVTGAAAPVAMGKGLSFTVAGPMKPEIEALQASHDAFLKTKEDRTEAALASFTDTSVPNLSSLVLLAEVKGRRILLTGDARGDKILEGLELAGLMEPGCTLKVDVLKMPHHGSDRNMEQGFLERILADHYVFSGDGKHGNPERAVMEMLQRARPDAAYAIHLTYPVDEIDASRKEDWEKEQRKERSRKKKNPNTVVREDWSPATHGLAGFFAEQPEMAGRVRVVPEEGSHLIELLDPLKI
jgi:hypothetical protein